MLYLSLVFFSFCWDYYLIQLPEIKERERNYYKIYWTICVEEINLKNQRNIFTTYNFVYQNCSKQTLRHHSRAPARIWIVLIIAKKPEVARLTTLLWAVIGLGWFHFRLIFKFKLECYIKFWIVKNIFNHWTTLIINIEKSLKIQKRKSQLPIGIWFGSRNTNKQQINKTKKQENKAKP